MNRVVWLLTIVLCLCTNASADVVTYAFDDPNDGLNGFSYTDHGSGVVATIANGGLGKFDVGPDNTYGDVLRTAPTSISFPGDHAGLKQAAIDNNWYYSVQITRGSAFDLGSISMDVGRGGSTGLRGFFVRSSVDAYASDLYYLQDLQAIDGMNPYSISLTGHLAQTDVTFRFYSYTNATGRYVDYSGLSFSAPAAAVPEPSAFAVFSLASVCGVCVKYCQKLTRRPKALQTQ